MKRTTSLIAAALAFTSTSWAGAKQDIVDTAKQAGSFQTLLEASGLDLPVASATNYTVFAPTNEAWDARDQGSRKADIHLSTTAVDIGIESDLRFPSRSGLLPPNRNHF